MYLAHMTHTLEVTKSTLEHFTLVSSNKTEDTWVLACFTGYSLDAESPPFFMKMMTLQFTEVEFSGSYWPLSINDDDQ